MVVPRGWENWCREALFSGRGVSVWGGETVLELDGGDQCTNVRVLIATKPYA